MLTSSVKGSYVTLVGVGETGCASCSARRREPLVIKMKHSLVLLGPEFGPFLYASVGDEGNGMMLSVLSTLARRDLDPWKEAAELAKLPVDAAARRLASLIAGLPGTAGRLEAGGAASRLILLLPKRAKSTTPQNETVINGTFGMTKGALIVWMVWMSLVMSVQLLGVSRQAPAQTKQATASAAISVPSTKGPRLDPGQ